MHPTVVSDKQGVCPVCHMDLVRKGRPGEEVKVDEALTRLLKSPNESVVSSIGTTRGEFLADEVTTPVTGVVTYDSRRLSTIAVRSGGRLEKVGIKYPYQTVRKGQPIAEIYSTELVSAQRELLLLLQQADRTTLIEAAKSKLLVAGFTQSQLDNLLTTHQVSYNTPLVSPVDGYVLPLMQTAPAVAITITIMGMDGRSEPVKPIQPTILLQEGDYVTSGTPLWKVADTRSVLVELAMPATLTNALQVGDSIELEMNNRMRKASVEFIQPFYDDKGEFAIVRVYVPGQGLKIGSLVQASVRILTTKQLWVPRQAVMDLGTSAVVFVKVRGAFVPKPVVVHNKGGNKLAISGISLTDEIASNAQLMTDSEGFVRVKN
ncbi:MAG: efflux RND transporter periplasmic adaptor subunit [Cytophagales bacterium]|nr:efflux RND transporter periplasmic adaptor subunit [Cytophagales bacterium]